MTGWLWETLEKWWIFRSPLTMDKVHHRVMRRHLGLIVKAAECHAHNWGPISALMESKTQISHNLILLEI